MTDDEVIAHWGQEPLGSLCTSSSGDVEVVGQTIVDPESITALSGLIKTPGLPTSTFGDPMDIGEERKVLTSSSDVLVIRLRQIIRGTPDFRVNLHNPQVGLKKHGAFIWDQPVMDVPASAFRAALKSAKELGLTKNDIAFIKKELKDADDEDVIDSYDKKEDTLHGGGHAHRHRLRVRAAC